MAIRIDDPTGDLTAGSAHRQRVDDHLWCLDSHFVVWGCRGSLRMTVVETSSGLVIYSPVRMTSDIVAGLSQIGRVAVIIAPNLYHHMVLRPCQALFPEARVLVPRGLEAKIGAVPGAEVVTSQTVVAAPDELGHVVFDGRAIRETMLVHQATGTLITADLVYNYGPRQHLAERTFFRAIGCYGAPKVAFYHRFSIEDKRSVRRLIETVLAWQVRRIILCHGDTVESPSASAAFAAAWERFAA
jgi:hypothetical protein